jgi:hypothetical protein
VTICHSPYHCGRDISADDHDAAPYITGLEVKGAGAERKGGRDVIRRERTGEWACGECVAKMRHHIPPGQGELL